MTISFEMIGWAFAAFFVLFALQICIAFKYKPVSEDTFILLLFTVTPFLLFLLALCFRFFSFFSVEDGIAGYLLFFVLCSSWVASYPAVYAACPSLLISYLIYRCPDEGISLHEISEIIQLKQNSDDRIDDAVHDKWITKSGDVIELTRFGQIALCCFRVYRRLLGASLETL